MSIDMPEVAVSVLLVCACAGAAMPNIPQAIAKAVTTAAVRVVFIKQNEIAVDLKDI
jgi:predicted Na+-dependent transporter